MKRERRKLNRFRSTLRRLFPGDAGRRTRIGLIQIAETAASKEGATAGDVLARCERRYLLLPATVEQLRLALVSDMTGERFPDLPHERNEHVDQDQGA